MLDERLQLVAVLEQLADAEATSQPPALSDLARAVGTDEGRFGALLEQLDALGLAYWSPEGIEHPVVLRAGLQFIERDGRVEPAVLRFLPAVIDDLTAREALLNSGRFLVDQFRDAVLAGAAVQHARTLVPEAFSRAITHAIALDLYAAAVALIARLSSGQPAGCLAEEIMAVELIAEATDWIEDAAASGRIDEDTTEQATDALRSLFELFEDDEVLDLLAMREPSDGGAHRPQRTARRRRPTD